MIDARLRELASRQQDVVATWQLTAVGWTEARVAHNMAGYRRLHDGVHLVSHAPPGPWQLWWAATLTTPDTTLSHTSAGASYGVWPDPGRVHTVTRPGSGGPTRIGDLLVMRSSTLGTEDIAYDRGLRRTTIERTLIDLAPRLSDRRLRKLLREALRLGLTTAPAVLRALRRHRGRRGVAKLRVLADRYVRLPIARCKSDAEAMALELLDGAGRPIPQVNVLVAGEEADQFFADLGRIIEIDGPGYHRLKDDDARKTAAWRAAGIRVDRIASGDVFDHPERYLALAPPRSPPGRRTSISPGQGGG
ncbi:MAG: hypothetical protein JWN65_4227 [Solirubrobacterales bacterium]|nr:hypothetical protein [Solirubrobacterales bacterium]